MDTGAYRPFDSVSSKLKMGESSKMELTHPESGGIIRRDSAEVCETHC